MHSMQHILAEAIVRWLEDKRSRSERSLSRLTDVSYSSVRRAAAGDSEQSPAVVLPLAAVVMSPTELKEFIHTFYPKLERAIAGGDYLTDKADDVIDFLYSEDHARIIMLASGSNGTTSEDVCSQFGAVALPFFEDVAAAGILTKRNGAWHFDRDIGTLSLPVGRRLLLSIVKSCGKSNDAIPNASYALAGWESLDSIAVKKIYSIMEDAGDKVSALLSDKNNRGDILVAFGFLHNVIRGAERLI